MTALTQSALAGGSRITRAAGPFSVSAPSLCGSRPGTGENPGRGNHPSMETLSATQVRLLFFVAGYLAVHDGIAPRLADMAAHLGLRSRCGAHRHFAALEAAGWVRRMPAKGCAFEMLAWPSVKDRAGADWLFVPGDCLAFHGGCHA